MEEYVAWLMVLVGVVVGMVSGVVGIGGGILFVPALVWLFGMDQHRAQGTSLGALLAPVGILAFWEYYRKGNADIRIAALLAVGFLVGGYFGAVGAQHVSDVLAAAHLRVTLVPVGGWMFFQANIELQGKSSCACHETQAHVIRHPVAVLVAQCRRKQFCGLS